MRAELLETPRPIDVQPLRTADVAAPHPVPGELTVDVAACGVCRTDLQLCEGDLAARRLPVVPGHQVVGIRAIPSQLPGGAEEGVEVFLDAARKPVA